MSETHSSLEDVIKSKPEDWEERRLGDLFKQRKEKNRPDLPLLAVTGAGGVVPRDSLERRDTSNADKSKYLRVCEGDIAYNTMRMWQGVSGLSAHEGIVSPAYTICQPVNSVSSGYMSQLFKLPELIQVFHRNSQGLVDDTLNLKFENFSPIRIPVPPLPEQKKIAAILSSVDDVIEKTRAQIDKLKDLKTGMMQELLTKGIGHTAFKDSPVGRIPEGWEVKTLGQLGECVRGLTYSPDDIVDKGLLVLRSSNIVDGMLDFDDSVFVNAAVDARFKSRRGDILICVRNGSRALLGKSTTIDKEMNATHGAFMTVFRSPYFQYVQHLIKSDMFFSNVSRDIGATINSINNGNLLQYQFPIPPVSEQSEISAVLNALDSSVRLHKRKLVSLEHQKKALMQDLLTGKVRVNVDNKENAVA